MTSVEKEMGKEKCDTNKETARDDGTETSAGAIGGTDEEGWSFHPNHRKGQPTLVTPRIEIGKVSAIDTAKCTAEVEVLVWLHWKDERLVEWNRAGRRRLPDSLWTPRLRIAEAYSEAAFCVTMSELHLHDEKKGGMYSLTRYEGMISNPMDLRSFPVDHDTITFTFLACETYARDGQLNVNFKDDYRLLVKGEGWEVIVKTPFVVTEWELEGTLVKYVRPEHCQDVFEVTLYVRRNSSFYVYKMLVPLFLTILMGQVAFVFPPEDLENKSNLMATLLLSTFALIYVLSQDIPKTSFLTLIDKIVLATMGSIVLMALLSGTMYKLHEHGLEELSHELNSVGLVFCPVAYILLCAALLVPAWRKRSARLRSLFEDAKATTGRDDHPWKLVDTMKMTNGILKDNPQIFESVVKEAEELLRAEMSEEEEQRMLERAEQVGILRVTVGGKRNGHAPTWEECQERAEELGGALPTKDELGSSGVHAGKNDLWMPVARKDGAKRDWCQIGDHFARRGQRYISHQDEYGPPQWLASSYPITQRPAAYFYAMFDTPQKWAAARQRLPEEEGQRNRAAEQSGGGPPVVGFELR